MRFVGYRLIAVHDQIRDEMYKPRYEIVSKMSEDKITYEMIIRGTSLLTSHVSFTG